jgi:WD40 repeat protein
MSSADQHGAQAAVLLAAGTAHYDCSDFLPLDKVPASLQTVVEALSGLGYSAFGGPPGYVLDPDRDDLEGAVHDASRAAPIVVIYYTGHAAHPERGGYYLVTRKSDADNLTLRGVAATQLAEALNRYDGGALAAEQPEVLIILDCCYSGGGGQEILAAALRGSGNENTWVIASAGRLEEAQQGLFAAAFADALQRPRTRPGQPYLSFEDVVGAINIALNARADQKARFFVPSGGASSTPRFLPNPLFQEPSSMEHWLSLVRSGPDQTVSGFYLTGRTGRVRASEDLARWMADPSRRGLAVVTGSPGTGKSAVLALVVLLSLPSERAVLLGAAEIAGFAQRTADLLPPGTVSSSIHARRLLSDQVAALIAQSLDRHADSASALLEDLDTTPEKNSRVIVVDAVDEAASPGTLLRSLLVPLASQPGIKVVIGARRHVLHPSGQPDPQVDLEIDLDAETYQDPQALTDYVYQLLIASHEPGITTPYQTAAGPGGGEAQKMVADVAAAIARRATARSGAQSFLIARLLALSVRARTEMVDTGSDWLADLPASVGAAFDQDLARLGDKTQVARILLEALAWANGPGLPWENVWIPVARALQDRDRPGQDGAVTDDDVRWLFNKAGAYITEDLGPGGRSVFRPFHDLLAVHLRGQPSREAEDADPAVASAWRQHSVQAEQAVVGALVGTVSTAGSSRRDWISAHPYLRTYLAQHAKAAEPDTFPALVHDVDFLAVADPATLIPLLPATDPELRDIARVYRRASPLLYDQPHANAAYLQEAAYALTGAAIESDADITPLYRTTLAAARPDDSLLTIVFAVGGSPAGEILSVAFGSGAGGRTLLACGCADGTVRLLDPATGDPVGPPLTGHGAPVNSVAFSTAGGPALLASGGEDGTVRLWDPASGNPVGGTEISPSGPDMVQPDDDQFQTFQRLYQSVSYGSGSIRVDPLRNPVATGAVKCVAFGPGTGPALLLAAGSDDQTVRVWDLATGKPAGPPLTGHTGRVDQGWQQVDKDGHPVGPIHYSTGAVNSVAFSTAGGTVLLASAGADGTVRLWHWATGEPAGPSLGDGTQQVRSVAFGTVPEHQQLVAAGADHSTAQLCTGPEGPKSLTPSEDHHSPLRLWDAASGVEIGLPTDDPDSTYGVRAVAFGSDDDGRNLLASAGEDTTLRLWDPATGQPVGRPLVGHSERVNTVAFGTDGSGRALLASGSNDGTVRLWDPTVANHAPPPLSRQAAFICSVAFGTGTDGRPLLASADLNGDVQLWDPVRGTPLRPALPGGGSMVYGSAPLALGTASDGRLLLAFDSEHDGLRLWDLATEEFVGSPLTGHTGHVYSVAFGTGTGPALLASGGEDGTVRRWDPATGDPIGSPLTGHDGPVFSVASSAGTGPALLASAGMDGTVRRWDPATGDPIGPPLTGHDGPVLSVAFSAGTGPALLASAGMDGTVRLWNPATGDPIGPPLSDGTEQVPPVGSIAGLDGKDEGPANARTELVAFVTTTGGRAIVASADAVAVRLWDPATAARLSVLDRRSSVYCVAGAGALLAIGDEEGISVIELNQ